MEKEKSILLRGFAGIRLNLFLGFYKYYIYIYLQEVGWEGVDWIDMSQDRDRWRALVNAVMNLRVP
jgi:hypothetical protein